MLALGDRRNLLLKRDEDKATLGAHEERKASEVHDEERDRYSFLTGKAKAEVIAKMKEIRKRYDRIVAEGRAHDDAACSQTPRSWQLMKLRTNDDFEFREGDADGDCESLLVRTSVGFHKRPVWEDKAFVETWNRVARVAESSLGELCLQFPSFSVSLAKITTIGSLRITPEDRSSNLRESNDDLNYIGLVSLRLTWREPSGDVFTALRLAQRLSSKMSDIIEEIGDNCGNVTLIRSFLG